jgi:hypothetical protein
VGLLVRRLGWHVEAAWPRTPLSSGGKRSRLTSSRPSSSPFSEAETFERVQSSKRVQQLQKPAGLSIQTSTIILSNYTTSLRRDFAIPTRRSLTLLRFLVFTRHASIPRNALPPTMTASPWCTTNLIPRVSSDSGGALLKTNNSTCAQCTKDSRASSRARQNL